MEFLQTDVECLHNTIPHVLQNEEVQKMKEFIQHGNTSTYEHCMNVALQSLVLARMLRIRVDVKSMLVGAMLHDFFLYDWHDGRLRPEGIHGFTHPKTALGNARRCFSLNSKEENIIKSHMFPETLFLIPKSREALLVSVADKTCSVCEALEEKTLLCFVKDNIKRICHKKLAS